VGAAAAAAALVAALLLLLVQRRRHAAAQAAKDDHDSVASSTRRRVSCSWPLKAVAAACAFCGIPVQHLLCFHVLLLSAFCFAN
jgi:hypothetical protein